MGPEPVQAKFLEVSAGKNVNPERLIKKFMKKVRKEEILKPFYGKLMYHQTKNQKDRKKRLRSTYLAQKSKNELGE